MVCPDSNRFVSHCTVSELDGVLGEGGWMVHYSARVGLVASQASSTRFKGSSGGNRTALSQDSSV